MKTNLPIKPGKILGEFRFTNKRALSARVLKSWYLFSLYAFVDSIRG